MTLIITLTEEQEARLIAAAASNGIPPEEVITRLLDEGLSTMDQSGGVRQALPEQSGNDMRHSSHTEALFAQWAEEDTKMTDVERAENNRIYAEIEKNGIPRVRI